MRESPVWQTIAQMRLPSKHEKILQGSKYPRHGLPAPMRAGLPEEKNGSATM